MIHQDTIDDIFNLDMDEVIRKDAPDLKKKGINYMAKSPFNDEKTASFSVNTVKGVWKCFSSGKGGRNAVSFVMQLHNLTYPDAIRKIAEAFNIEVKVTNDEENIVQLEKRQKQFDLYEINAVAFDFFQDKIRELDESLLRMTYDQALEEGMGFADNDFGSLLNHLLKKGYSKNQMILAGLIVQKEKGAFDVFNERIIFPIFASKTQIAGFSGRRIDGKKEIKYLNTKDTLVFNKSKLFIGIEKAAEEIRRTGSVILVEGNFDISALRIRGVNNVLASAGTAFTEDHIQELLKLGVKRAQIFYDADKAGLEATLKAIDLIISSGIHPEAILLPEGFDPDSFFNSALYRDIFFPPENSKFKAVTAHEAIEGLKKDGGFLYIEDIFKDADQGVKQRAAAEDLLERFLVQIPDEKIRKSYIEYSAKEYKLSITDLKKNVNLTIKGIKELAEEDQEEKYRFPRKLTPEEKKSFEDQVQRWGFYEDTTPLKYGYWFLNQYKAFERVSNFLIKPLFHIKSQTNNRRLVEIRSENGSAILEAPSKGFVNVSGFTEECIKHLAVQWIGSARDFKLTSLKFLNGAKEAIELTYLGWQPEGFFAFANGLLIDGDFKPVDEYGMVRARDKFFFMPAYSKIHKESRDSEDDYESDRALEYRNSDITFGQWAKMYHDVYGENGMISIAFLMGSLFRDHIQKKQTFFPILFNFGAVQTGKSSAARGINAVLQGNTQPVMLNSVTGPAFVRKLGQFANVPMWFDEWRNDLDEKIKQGSKALWDGVGSNKAKYSSNNKTQNDPIRGTGIYSGQYYPAGDDNAFLTRCCLLTYTTKTDERTVDETRRFNKLVDLQGKGLSHIVGEILRYRDYFVDNYDEEYFARVKQLKNYFDEKRLSYDGRVANNFATLLSVVKTLQGKVELPFTYEDLEKHSIELIQRQSDSIQNSDILQNYWKTIEYLFIQGQVEIGADYKIEARSECKLYTSGSQSDQLVRFDKSRMLLFIQFKKIHPLYMEAHKKQFNETGTTEGTIKSYMKSSKAFVGITSSFQFEKFRTSAWVFDYGILKNSGIDLELSPIFNADSKPIVSNVRVLKSTYTSDDQEALPLDD